MKAAPAEADHAGTDAPTFHGVGAQVKTMQSEMEKGKDGLLDAGKKAPDECSNGVCKATLERAAKIQSSFAQPRSPVLAFAALLAACAGAVNVISWLELGSFVSHVSGNISHIGMRSEGIHAGRDTPEDLFFAVGLLVAFMAGSMICGLLSARKEVRVGRELHSFALLGNALLLLLAYLFAATEYAKFFAAAACGLQNSMCSVYFGAVCRTTHLTGLTTDMGTTLGRLLAIVFRSRCLRGQFLDPVDCAELSVELAKLKVFCMLGFGFLSGAIGGTWCARFLGVHALLMPAAVTGVSGATYMIYHQIAQVQQPKRQTSGPIVTQDDSSRERARSFLEDYVSETSDGFQPDSFKMGNSFECSTEAAPTPIGCRSRATSYASTTPK